AVANGVVGRLIVFEFTESIRGGDPKGTLGIFKQRLNTAAYPLLFCCASNDCAFFEEAQTISCRDPKVSFPIFTERLDGIAWKSLAGGKCREFTILHSNQTFRGSNPEGSLFIY